ncbi:MAG: DNA polymerase III subunit gamma/tau, partial [Alphaproteobacteria bacterium]
MLEQVTVAQKQLGYLVLARKYRPQKFSDLVGQEALVRTLQHAFSSGRIAHAFMLTGIRGVGKTTTARIIAKGLNCASTSEPTMEPCGQCGPCLGIAQGRHVDVLEMDAASRTGIDDIREILDSVAYKPVEARYKLYIIDEVHMLSKAAFNGLLKTLEEPPPHVKFLFATTEIKKVPVTVLSRCQRFDLRRIEVSEIASYLDHVCQQEQVDAEPHALKRLARASEGSMRD